jgi:hypothetical protein
MRFEAANCAPDSLLAAATVTRTHHGRPDAFKPGRHTIESSRGPATRQFAANVAHTLKRHYRDTRAYERVLPR